MPKWNPALTWLSVALLVLVMIGGILWLTRMRPEPDNSSFGKIRAGMVEGEISRILKSEGEVVSSTGWPKKLGDILGFEKGWDFLPEVSLTIYPDEPIRWVKWAVNDEHEWVAVGFLNMHMGGSLSWPDARFIKSGLRDITKLRP